MAEDAISVLDFLDWKDERGVHVVGISLGGMIAMGSFSSPAILSAFNRVEIFSFSDCYRGRVPNSQAHRESHPGRDDRWRKILSGPFTFLTPRPQLPTTEQSLFSFSRPRASRALSGTFFTPFTCTYYFNYLHYYIRAPFIADPNEKVALVLGLLYPEAWLESPNEDEPSKTNREVQTAVRTHPKYFTNTKSQIIHSLTHALPLMNPSSQSYLKRVKLTRPQPTSGAISQMLAATTHRVDPSRLHTIATSISKILIITGDDDHLVAPANSDHLARCMPEAEYVVWDGTGHAINAQWYRRFNEILERVFEEGRKASA